MAWVMFVLGWVLLADCLWPKESGEARKAAGLSLSQRNRETSEQRKRRGRMEEGGG